MVARAVKRIQGCVTNFILVIVHIFYHLSLIMHIFISILRQVVYKIIASLPLYHWDKSLNWESLPLIKKTKQIEFALFLGNLLRKWLNLQDPYLSTVLTRLERSPPLVRLPEYWIGRPSSYRTTSYNAYLRLVWPMRISLA